MTPGQQLQRLLADVPRYESDDVVSLLPFVAALQSALHTRMLALQHQAAFPDTDYLMSTDEIAKRLDTSVKWVRENTDSLPFAIRIGKEYRFSARGFEDWISKRQAIRMAPALPPERRQHAR